MKYKVIGWTFYENYEIPFYNKTISFAERHAIIDEIKKNKYLFSGWHHQESWENCVPILSDGKKRGFSQRGWGGMMAEAYGYMEDYDYARFTFEQSIDDEKLVFPKEEFNPDNFIPEVIENEHFDVEVNEGLFEIAKKKNPFYLDELEELRSLAENDVITLHYQDEKVNFLVKDVNINKKDIDFSSSHLISTPYKIVIEHKPFEKNIIHRKYHLITRSQVYNTFKDCLKNYNFDVLVSLFESYDDDFILGKRKTLSKTKTIKRFIDDYSHIDFQSRVMVSLLKYLDDFDFFKQIAYQSVKQNNAVLIGFVNFYLDKDININKHILKAVSSVKKDYRLISNLLLRAIDLKPQNKAWRKKYYQANWLSNNYGVVLLAGGDLLNYLRKGDRYFIELDDFKKLGYNDVLDIITLFSYPNYNVSDNPKYPYRTPGFYSLNCQSVLDGLLKYQEYVNDRFDLINRLEELALYGIDDRLQDIEMEAYGYQNNAEYIYALDALTGFRFNLKNKAITKYGLDYPHLVEALNEKYGSDV